MRPETEDRETGTRRRRPSTRSPGAPRAESRRAASDSVGEANFQRFAESSEDVFWLADLSEHCLLYVSPRFEQLWGVRADQLIQDPAQWNRALLPEDAKRIPMPFFADDPAHGETVREYRIRARNGGTRWIRDRRFHLRDEDGHTVRVGGIAEDVTERKQREIEVT